MAVKPAPLKIRLFGPMQVLVNGEPLPKVRTRSVLWLLAMLTFRHGRPIERSWLAGTLWPESTEGQALKNLRDDLMRLRSVLCDEAWRIQSPSRSVLLLDLDGADVDMVRFDEGIRGGDPESLAAAVMVYTGPLLEGCYEEWVLTERQSRASACLEALESLAEWAQESGRYEDAIRWARQAESLDPLRDSTTRRLMAALESAGDPAAAIEAYRNLRDRLQTELSSLPDDATTRLFRDVRSRARKPGDSAVVRAEARGTGVPTERRPLHGAHLLRPPHPLTPLIGREEDVRAVCNRLESARLVTLVGAGGVGKTRLANEVAAISGDKFDAGAVWVDLAPLEDQTLLMPAIAAALGIREVPGSAEMTLPKRIVARLDGETALTVLDNCEHLIEAAAAAVETLLHATPGLKILATSRERLGLPGEVVLRVPSLALPETQELPLDDLAAIDCAMESPAVRLFVDRAVACRDGFQIAGRGEADTLCAICRRLDGIPLAIELAAARVDALTPQQILQRLGDRFALLSRGARSAPARQKTLRGLIDWSYDLLSPPERALLARLSVFAGGWTLETAVELASAEEGWSEADALDRLTSLTAKSLVVADTPASSARYRMLETVREYAAERLAERREAEWWHDRHFHVFLAVAESAALKLTGPDSAEWLARLETEHDNLRAAFAWVTTVTEQKQVPAEAGLRMAAAMTTFWQTRGYLSEGRRWLSLALARAGGEATTLRARCLCAAGSLALLQCDSQAARPLLNEALAISHGLGDALGIAAAHRGLGDVARTLGEYPEAKEHFQEVLRINRELGDRRSAARAFQNLGLIARERGENDAAEALYSEGLSMMREVGDRQAIALTLNSLGVVAFDRMDYPTAEMYYLQALEVARELGEHVSLAASLHNLGMVAFTRGEYEAARSYYEEALAINQAVGNRSFEASNLTELGNMAALGGDFAQATSLQERALAIRRELNLQPGIAASLEAFACLTVKQGRLRQGALLWGTAQALRVSIHSPIPRAKLSEYSADLAHARTELGDHDFELALAEGGGLTADEAVEFALVDNRDPVLRRQPYTGSDSPLGSK